jgi:glutathione S-transferase
MMELWHSADARSFRPLWMLEEMALPYRLHLLPFPPRYRQPDYLAINPLGTIPFLRDGAVELTESVAMLAWIGERYGPTPLLVEAAEPERAAFLNYLFQADATFTFPQTLVLRYRVLEPQERRQPAVADAYATWFLRRMDWVERGLADGREWLVAGRFTAADIAVGYACLLADVLGLMGDLGPGTHAWWARCTTRKGYAAARLAQGNGLMA